MRDRAAGRRIALANGCFDPLHVGHIRYPRGAATEADRLIGGERRSRGGGLEGSAPIAPASERAEILAALQAVDYVIEIRVLRRSIVCCSS